MSAELVAEWQERVEEVRAQLRLVEDDTSQAEQGSRDVKRSAAAHCRNMESEKESLLRELEEVEQAAQLLKSSCETTLLEKEEVENLYVMALDEYEQLHFEVRALKDMEEEGLTNRVHYGRELERETSTWAEEERKLRSELSRLEKELQLTKKQCAMELAERQAEQRHLEEVLTGGRELRATLLAAATAAAAAAGAKSTTTGVGVPPSYGYSNRSGGTNLASSVGIKKPRSEAHSMPTAASYTGGAGGRGTQRQATSLPQQKQQQHHHKNVLEDSTNSDRSDKYRMLY